jgi:hypothetical protein
MNNDGVFFIFVWEIKTMEKWLKGVGYSIKCVNGVNAVH